MKIYLILILISLIVLLACKAASKKSEVNNNGITNDLEQFTDALYPIVMKGKWGYMNNKLKVVIQPKFQYAEDFSEGIAAVQMAPADDAAGTGLYGYIDSVGNIIIPCRYDKADAFRKGLAVVAKNGRYGFVDRSGKELIPLMYEDASNFSEGLAAVKLNGKNGFIDHDGKMIIPPQFARACWVSEFSQDRAAVYTSEEGRGGYIDKSGKMIIPAEYSYVGQFSEGLALVQPSGKSHYGYIDLNGEMVIEPQYALGLSFSEGLATVKWTKPDGTEVFRIIDRKGKIIADELRYAFAGIFCEGLAGVESWNNLWGFIDKTGKEVIKPQFAGVKLFRNGLSRMETGSLFGGLKTVYINKKGKIAWQEE